MTLVLEGWKIAQVDPGNREDESKQRETDESKLDQHGYEGVVSQLPLGGYRGVHVGTDALQGAVGKRVEPFLPQGETELPPPCR